MSSASDDSGVQLHDDWLRVELGSRGGKADFHYRWLRHNCAIDCHRLTNERIVDSSDLPDLLGVAEAKVVGQNLHVRWRHDGRTSTYALAWLAEHAYGQNRNEAPPPPGDLAPVEVDGRGLSLRQRVSRAKERLDREGLAVVRRDRRETVAAADETELLIDAFAQHGLRVRGTHFGRIEDLRTDNTTNENTDQLGYTDAGIELHTDQPFIERPPRFQMLQAIRSADEGGENYLVDAIAALRWIGSKDRRTLELLSSVRVGFHRRQRSFESVVESPILGGTADAQIVRYSYFTMSPHRLPFDQMDEWYRAYDRFARAVRDPRHQIRFALRPGDFLVYDNHRMLHARTSFRGPRWVRGVYFDPGSSG